MFLKYVNLIRHWFLTEKQSVEIFFKHSVSHLLRVINYEYNFWGKILALMKSHLSIILYPDKYCVHKLQLHTTLINKSQSMPIS